MLVSSPRPHRFAPDLVLLGIAIVWGGSYLATKDLAEATTPATVMSARFLPAALILLTLVALRRQRGLRRALRPGLALGALRAATIALETIGVTLTTATNAGVIIGLSILLTPLFESLRLKRRITASLLGSVTLALLGIAALVGGQGFSTPNAGDVLIICAAVTRAALGVAEAHVTAQPRSDVLALTTVEIAFGAALFTLWGGADLWSHAATFTPAQWASIGYLSLGCTVFAFLGQLWATKHTSASRAGLLLGTEPLWALMIGIFVAGETLGPIGAIGAAALLIATVWGRRAEERWRLQQPRRE